MYLTAAQIGFALITLVYVSLLYREFRLALPKTSLTPGQQEKFVRNFLIVAISWLVFVYAWSRFGVFSRFELFPFNTLPVILVPLGIVLVFVFSKTGKAIMVHLPQENIVKLQVFRFYVEVLLWALFASALLPKQMTFEGYNFDIVTGATASLVATLIAKNKFPRFALIAWNVMGLGLLITIVVIAILSMPSPLRYFMNEPANTVITGFPISLLPACLVPLAYLLHLISLRKVFLKGE